MINFEKTPKNQKYFNSDMLFHYTKLEHVIEKILPSQSLRFSSFKNVNDPCEKGDRNLSINWSSADDIDSSKIDSFKYRQIMNKVRLEESKLLCFSRNFDNIKVAGSQSLDTEKYYKTGFFKPRMWAQYGENHRGICLAFNRDILAKEISKTYKSYDFYRGNIKYSDSILNIRKAYHVGATNDMINDFRSYFIKEHLIKFREELFFTKNTDWRDENEYRFLLIANDDAKDCYVNIKSSLRAIFCGVDFPLAYMESLRYLVSDLDVEIFKLEISDGIPHVFKQ